MKQAEIDLKPFDAAQKALNQNIPFCIFRLPNGSVEHFFAFGQNPPQTGEYLVVRGWQSDQPYYFSSAFHTQPIERAQATTVPEATSFDDYANQFKKLTSAFSNSALQKAILSRIKNIDRPANFSPIEAFSNLCDQRSETFNYLLLHPTHGLWMGASPEVLLRTKGDTFQTVSLAGTQKKDRAPYLWTDKESEEQELVSQHIRQILSESGVTNMTETGPFTAEAGNVVHLKSTFLFQLQNDNQALELVSKLHPTPAIAGLPVPLAVNTIQQTETHDRLLYTGFIGTVSNSKKIDLYVNLRCMQIHKDQISIYVGGGITAQSELHAEWEETEEKSKTLNSIIYA